MNTVYDVCPQFENNRYLLRLVRVKDCSDLLKVYSDKDALKLFSSDNCGDDNFYYTTKHRMKKAIDYWLWEYNRRGFVRWSIVDKQVDEVVGTIELFHRDSNDYFTNCGLLRLDLRSDREKFFEIKDILSLILLQAFGLFNCDKIATKAISQANERIEALISLGFCAIEENLVGHNGEIYRDYYALDINNMP